MKELTRTVHANAVDFKTLTQVVEEVGERFGRFQDGDCREKEEQAHCVGRSKHWTRATARFLPIISQRDNFRISSEFRELGVLDEDENVLVPNYVGPHTNCSASSSLYSM